MENTRGTLYTSYYNKLDTKAFLDFTGIVIPISRQLPSDNRITYEMQDLRLAPSQTLFNNYKGCKISWLQYEDIFFSELDNEVINDLCKILDGGDNILLLCYEKSNRFCHRRLVGEKVKEKGYTVKEL